MHVMSLLVSMSLACVVVVDVCIVVLLVLDVVGVCGVSAGIVRFTDGRLLSSL